MYEQQRACPAHRIACPNYSSEVFGQSDESAISRVDHIVTADLCGERRLRHSILAKAVKVEFRVERMQVVILADLSVDARCRRIEVQILVVVAPRILGKTADRAQVGEALRI